MIWYLRSIFLIIMDVEQSEGPYFYKIDLIKRKECNWRTSQRFDLCDEQSRAGGVSPVPAGEGGGEKF